MPEQATRPRNPYIAGNPVGNSRAFIGRSDVLRAVRRVLRDPERHGIVLYGQRRIGKTSILQHLVSSLHGQDGGAYRPVYFDLQDKARWSLSDVLIDQARGIAAALGLPTPVAEGDPSVWFRSKWLPSVLERLPSEASLVVLLDEFDVLADVRSEHAASALFPYLRQLLDQCCGRLRFIFVIGRNVDDLANVAHALFKNLPAERVSLLAREDAEVLMRMSEANGTMTWNEDAVETAWALTSGHPFLLQQLCWELWERLHDDSEVNRHATAKDVEQVTMRALDTARPAFEWLWKGLPPAERVVASALASAGARAISQDELEEVLHNSGVRVVMRELRDAPQLLEDWDLIEPAEGGYRFRVELLRRWIAKAKTLTRVQKELDYVEPIAENLYRAGEGHYKVGDLDAAASLFRQALGINPNHVRAAELYADVLIAREDWSEARRVLERLHEHNPPAARARLAQVLMALAATSKDEDLQLQLLDTVLRVQKHALAAATREQIWIARGNRAREAGNLEEALTSYREAGSVELEQAITRELRQRKLDTAMVLLREFERGEQYALAYDKMYELAHEFPDLLSWDTELARLKDFADLDRVYLRAVDAIKLGQHEEALRTLMSLVERAPSFKRVTALLHRVVTGVDVDKLTRQLGEEKKARAHAEQELNSLKEQCMHATTELALLRALLEAPPSRSETEKTSLRESRLDLKTAKRRLCEARQHARDE